VAVAAIVVVAALVQLGRPGEAPAPVVPATPPPYASGTTKGLAEAPVTIIEFSDFQ